MSAQQKANHFFPAPRTVSSTGKTFRSHPRPRKSTVSCTKYCGGAVGVGQVFSASALHFSKCRLRLHGILWGLLCLLTVEKGYTQALSGSVPAADVLLYYKLWTIDDGIPHWHLNGAFQDSRVFLWADWKGAVCRFDGRQWLEIAREEEGLHEFNKTYFAEISRPMAKPFLPR